MGSDHKIRYCALTTIGISMRQFLLPSLKNLSENGFSITAGCKADESIEAFIPENIRFLPLQIERGLNLTMTVRCIAQLYRFLRENKIEMIEYGTENVSFCAAIASWAAGVPIRIYNHWGARYVGYSGLSRQLSLFIERTAAFFSTDIRQQSDKNMMQCVQDRVYPRNKVSVIGFGGTVGADFSRFSREKRDTYRKDYRKKLGIPDDAFVFGDVGSIRRDKGSDDLLTAFRKLANPDVWLVLVGDLFEADAPDETLLYWAQNNDRVIFTGRVTDVEHYMAVFDYIVHPSYREGLGMVLQEAGAMGIPYITTDIPGPSEFGIDTVTGYLVRKGDSEDLFEKMNFVLQNREYYQNQSEAVYALTKERFERNIMLQRILQDRISLWREYTARKTK